MKIEEDCLKNEGGDRFLVNFKISEKIDPEKFAVHMFVSETFYKNYNILKLNKVFYFYKNWVVVCISSFRIRSNVIFSKKKLSDPPMPLKHIYL